MDNIASLWREWQFCRVSGWFINRSYLAQVDDGFSVESRDEAIFVGGFKLFQDGRNVSEAKCLLDLVQCV